MVNISNKITWVKYLKNKQTPFIRISWMFLWAGSLVFTLRVWYSVAYAEKSIVITEKSNIVLLKSLLVRVLNCVRMRQNGNYYVKTYIKAWYHAPYITRFVREASPRSVWTGTNICTCFWLSRQYPRDFTLASASFISYFRHATKRLLGGVLVV